MSGLRLYRWEGRRRARRLLFLLHNYGGNEFQIATIGSLLDPDGRFAIVCPRGPIETPDAVGGASFYNVDRATHVYDEPSVIAALAAVHEALDRACADGGFDRGEAIVGGFSQGGGLALALAFGPPSPSGSPRPAGVVTFCPPVHPPERVAWDLAGTTGVAAFVGHGAEDTTFPAERSAAFVEQLRAAGSDATWRGYPARHQVTIEAVADARDWLATR